jgi:hypothetical protein
MVVGIISSSIFGNILVSIIVSIGVFFVLDLIFKDKISSTELETIGFAPLNDITDIFSEILDAVERSETSWRMYLDLVNEIIILDENHVEWNLDPFSLTLYNDSGKYVSVENMKFNASFQDPFQINN